MKKLYLTIYISFVAFATQSCTFVAVSPRVSFYNSSPDGKLIKNIKVNWNGYSISGIYGSINTCSGGSLSQDFVLKKKSDIFGPVHAEWENAKGDKISKDFIFKKDDLKTNPYYLSSIYLFFTQTDVEYYTSDNPNIRKIEREKRGNWVYKWYEKEGKTKCVNDPKEVQRLREINKKYPVTSTVTGKPINDD